MADLTHDATAATSTTVTASTNLNELPEEILLRILSFLPTLDTITTSLVSQKWRSLWSLNPSLNFSYAHFPPYSTSSTTRQFFAQFIDRSLILRPHSPLLKFRLQFIFEDRYCSHVDSWVRYAIKNKTQELDLDFFIDKSFHCGHSEARHTYNFPFFVLRNGKVRVLRLCRCDLSLPVNVSSMRLWSMKCMHLDQIYLTDQMVVDLLSGCPNLEVLDLQNCYGMENLRVCSGKLKELELRYFYAAESAVNLQIDCPNVVSLIIVCFAIGEICIKNLSSLVRFQTSIVHKMDEYYGYWSKVVRLLDQVPHISSLAVQNWWLKLAPKDVFAKGFLLYNLKHLELQTGYTHNDLLGMAALLELSPNLETMILDYLFKVDEDESLSEELENKPINLSMPSLREVKMNEFTGTENETNFVALIKKQGVVLEKIVLAPAKVDDSSYPPPIILRKRPLKIQDIEGSSSRSK